MRPKLNQLLLAAGLALTGVAAAADLPRLLPAETLFAVGVEGLAEHEAKAQPFIDEWERLGLSELLENAFAEEAEDEVGDMPDLEGLNVGLLDLLGQEAWLSVSATSFNPLPALTLLARVTPDGMNAVTTMIAEEDMAEGATTMTEGSIEFTVVTVDEEDSPISAVAYATFDDLVLFSTNPEVARGVLRRYQGANEPGMQDNAGYQATLGSLDAGNGYLFVDLAAATDVAAPFASGMGMDALVARLSAAATTAGVYGSVTAVRSDGYETRSLRLLGDRELDPLLYDNLAGTPVSDRALAFVPAGALGVSASSFSLPGWWAWLEDVVAADPSLGIGDLDEMVEQSVGLDLQTVLLDWMGGEFATVTMGIGSTAVMPEEIQNPLGDSVYLFATDDEAAADAGLQQLFSFAIGMASSFMDPMGEGAGAAPAQRQVAGVTVTDWALADGFTLSTAVTGGYALVATTPESMDAVLSARAGNAALSSTLAPLLSRVPQGVRSFTLSDDRASLGGTADMLVDQLGMMSGMGGSDIDFDAVEAATAALAEFADFVVERLGGSVGYSTVAGQSVAGQSYSFVDW